MCVASCVPCHAIKGLRHGATTHDCSCGIGITLRNSRICSNSHCETWTCHTAIAASPPECAMMSFGLRSVVGTCRFIPVLGLTTHSPVAHSSPPWLVSIAQRSGFGIFGLGVSSRQQYLSACSASHVCAGVCVRLVLACPSMYAHQHTARMATTSLD